MMSKVLIYGYCVGVFSSRRLEKRLVEDIGFRVLAAGNEPDFRTIAEFRRIHLKALEGIFEQVRRSTIRWRIPPRGDRSRDRPLWWIECSAN